MGWRLRQIIRLGPLLRLNLSKTGVSLSAGKPGLTVNIGRGRARTTLSAPGTGVSYSTSTSLRSDEEPEETADVSTEPMAGTGGKSLVRTVARWLRRGR